MPIYEYICTNCGTDFEKLTSFSNTLLPSCPACDSNAVERQLGRPAIHFKGSGWYINDSKSSSKESANGSKGGKETTTDTSDSATKESVKSEKSDGGSDGSASTSSAPAPKADKAMAAD